jgi:hypothetical protein
MTRLLRLISCWIALSMCPAPAAPEGEDCIVAARRSGVIEFISPATLQTVGRIHLGIAPDSAGLNGIFGAEDLSTLYLEGPVPTPESSRRQGCCSLFSLDLVTLQTRMVASIWGSRSREAYIKSDGSVYPAAALGAAGIQGMSDDRLHLSPDRKLLFGVRNFRGPALDVYDLSRGQIVRSLAPEGTSTLHGAAGIWAGNRFYFYAASSDGGGLLWTLTPESTQLGAGVVVPAFPDSSCTAGFAMGIAASGSSLFLYEMFGLKVDRRRQCGEELAGGAWVVDPTTGRLLSQVAPKLHFSELISNPAGSELYGLTSDHADSPGPVTLVRIGASTGQVLQSRTLDADYWWIATARLKVVPAGNVHAEL